MKIALGVTGGIAAYKAAEIVRLLQDRGIRVQVVMTRAAQEFMRPLTFAALSGEKVITGMFAEEAPASGEEREQPNLDSGNLDSANIDSAIEHIAVAQSIDALLVAPATADVLAHFAQGIASDFLTTLYLATPAPVVVAPAMNVNMWNPPATQANLQVLRQRGVKIVEPAAGYLACGMTGAGRLAENETIVAAVMEALGASQDLNGETLLITAGPTREAFDPIRFVSNASTGAAELVLASFIFGTLTLRGIAHSETLSRARPDGNPWRCPLLPRRKSKIPRVSKSRSRSRKPGHRSVACRQTCLLAVPGQL